MTLSMKTSCRLCPPGQRVVAHCNSTHQTVCAPCPEKSFSAQFSLTTECTRCSTCRRKQILVKKCTPTRNVVCKCPDGYQYNPNKPCMKCEEDQRAVNGRCVPKKPPDRGVIRPRTDSDLVTPTQNYNDTTVPIILGSVMFCILILLIVIIVICFRKRQQNIRHHRNSKDLPPPEVPLKKGDYRSVNDYAPAPHIYRIQGPIRPTPLLREQFPESVVDGLRHLLDREGTNSYIDLAVELGHNDRCFLSKLRRHNDPVDFLINNYLTTSPTKESFVEALIKIGHDDAAKLVWEEVPSSPRFNSRVILA